MSTKLENLIKNKKAKIAIIGLGYVGLPTAVEIAKAGTERKKCEICKHDNETNATYCSNCGKLLTDV